MIYILYTVLCGSSLTNENITEHVLESKDAEEGTWTLVTGEWRKLDNKELHYLYTSVDFIRATNERERSGRDINNTWNV
jgi:hypothetical protein